MSKKKIILFIPILIMIIVLCIIGIKIYYDSQMIIIFYDSPTGEYTLEMRFTCAFSLSYYGKFYLITGDKKYMINNWAPEECAWISNTEFTIGSAGSYRGMNKYNANEIITTNNINPVEIYKHR